MKDSQQLVLMIIKVAKELLDSEASVSAVGDIDSLPYADQFIS
jgi:hypothetical protein